MRDSRGWRSGEKPSQNRSRRRWCDGNSRWAYSFRHRFSRRPAPVTEAYARLSPGRGMRALEPLVEQKRDLQSRPDHFCLKATAPTLCLKNRMSERGDLLELVCDAFGRLPAMSVTVRSWAQTERRLRAIDEVRRSRTGGSFALYRSSPVGATPAGFEHVERLLLAPQQGAFRVEAAASLPYLVLCDGTTTWTEITTGEFLRQQMARLQSPAVPLLDPSWLAGYTWDPPVRDTSIGREVIRMAVRPTSSPMSPRTSGLFAQLVPLQDAEVVIDVQLGFLHQMTSFAGLHQMTSFAGDQPYIDIKMLDIAVNPEIDDHVFRLDESRYRVVDRSELNRRDQPSLLQRARQSTARRLRRQLRTATLRH